MKIAWVKNTFLLGIPMYTYSTYVVDEHMATHTALKHCTLPGLRRTRTTTTSNFNKHVCMTARYKVTVVNLSGYWAVLYKQHGSAKMHGR